MRRLSLARAEREKDPTIRSRTSQALLVGTPTASYLVLNTGPYGRVALTSESAPPLPRPIERVPD